MFGWLLVPVSLASDLPPAVLEARGARLLSSVPAIPADAYARAHSGEVVTGVVAVDDTVLRKAWGVAVIDTPIDRFWAAINDDRSKPDYTSLGQVVLLDGEYCGPRRTVFQYLDVSVLSDRWWVVEQKVNTALADRTGGRVREMAWTSVSDAHARLDDVSREWAAKGVQVPFTEGSWLLADLGGGRTLVEYYAWSDPGGSVPAGMASRFAAGGISDTFSAMKRLAAAGPTCL